ncbi:MAG: relaxase domain-containing protein, partial [Proteobacteria bacterium]|nr:relaxase domain-containing protein [Pseudomonadota bacterium]
MLSVSRPMTAGEGARYFKADDYYLSEKGRWQGSGAEALGLAGEVRHEDFALALRGVHPGTGETLVAGKGDRHLAGLDLTFSAPKSVSLLALADPGVKAAHDRAVSRVLAYIEAHNAQAREQVDGERRAIATGNLAVAAFDHLTSRELDPQLHTHAVVLNLTQRADGEWRAVHNVSLYRDQLALGRLYRAELARNLGEAGYAIRVTDRMQGFFEVRGVPEGLLEAFSQRRQQVEERVQELQRSGEYPHASRARLYEIAALGSRAPKDKGVTKEALAESWRAELREHGWNIEDLEREARREGTRARGEREKPGDRPPAAWEILRTAVQAKTETESVFRKSEVLDVAARLSLGRFSLDEMEDAFRELERVRFLLSLGEHVADAKGTTVALHTTREMRNLERRILDHVNASRGGWTPLVGAPAVTAHIAAQERAQGWTHTKGQKEA